MRNRPRVIRCGQSKGQGIGTKRWSDAEILQAVWEMDDQRGIRKNPMRVDESKLDISVMTPTEGDEDGR